MLVAARRERGAQGWCIAAPLRLVSLALCACGGAFEPAPGDLGSTADDPFAPGAADGPFAPAPADRTRYDEADYLGAWVGVASDPLHPSADGSPSIYQFPSGSSEIRLVLEDNSGAITFGAGSPPEIDRRVGYPPHWDYTGEPLHISSWLPPLEGFAYTLFLQSDIDTPLNFADFGFPLERDGVVRLHYLQNEFASSWCGQQVPRPYTWSDGSVEYFCGEDTTGGARLEAEGLITPCFDLNNVPIDCGKLYLCATSPVRVCECTRSSCSINTDLRPTVHLRRQGDELVGVLGQGVFMGRDGLLTTLGEVRFRRER